ncbi:MAG: epoxyqueuosine reductase [Firmicutes bacterium]|nr:epoxyqueuosine reductase [Bacillota bacterium]
MQVTKETVEQWICGFVREYEQRAEISTKWGSPLVGFARAESDYIQNLPELIGFTHGLPQDVVPDASIVIAYYVPFTRGLAKKNDTGNLLAAPEWALAYEETNAMFKEWNSYLIERLKKAGYRAAVSPKINTFDRNALKSDWSHRHFAYAAGLGNFGVNNMLITRNGCCGRFGTIVTNLDAQADQPAKEEYCLYKKNGSCGVCMKNCPAGALTREGYNRNACYALLRKNSAVYTEFGSSYSDEEAGNQGSEVCGKCITQSPCAFTGFGDGNRK